MSYHRNKYLIYISKRIVEAATNVLCCTTYYYSHQQYQHRLRSPLLANYPLLHVAKQQQFPCCGDGTHHGKSITQYSPQRPFPAKMHSRARKEEAQREKHATNTENFIDMQQNYLKYLSDKYERNAQVISPNK